LYTQCKNDYPKGGNPLQAFDFASATTVDEVVALLQEKGDMARVMCGGTDLLVALREGRRKAELVIDVKRLPETTALAFDPQKGLTLGAAVPCYRMYDNKAVAAAYPGLIDAASLIGGVQIQGRASMGGNLCNASPAADSIPALIAHSAVCQIAGPNGRREMPVEAFCTAPGRNALQKGEFLVALHIPAPALGFGAAYLRFIPRNEMDIAVVGVGASVQLDETRTKFVAARIRWGRSRPRRSLCLLRVMRWLANRSMLTRLPKRCRLPKMPPNRSAICAARPNIANTWLAF